MNVTACLPITALRTLQVHDVKLLLAGSGSYLTVHDGRLRNKTVKRIRVFRCQNIHGIKSWPLNHTSTSNTALILIWGGKWLSIAHVTVERSENTKTLDAVEITIQQCWELAHWILDAVVKSAGQEAIVLTAQNGLYVVPLNTPLRHQSSPCRIGAGPQTLLYSGQVCLTDTDQLLIAAGTVFGDIIVWTYSHLRGLQQGGAQVRYTFTGHQGSIFGVCISPSFSCHGAAKRLLASCSDDRTIRIWDIASCDQPYESQHAALSDTKETGFGSQHGEATSLCLAWGHLSRIWSVYFLSTHEPEAVSGLYLVSTGEDGIYQTWNLDVDLLWSDNRGDGQALNPAANDRRHAGKNIWSFSYEVDGSSHQMFSGGADGKIVSRFESINARSSGSDAISYAFKDIRLHSSLEHQDCHQKSRCQSTLKQYLCFANGVVVATNDTGSVLTSHIDSMQDWCTVLSSGIYQPIVMSNSAARQSVFAIRGDGALFSYNALTRSVVDYQYTAPSSALWLDAIPVSSDSSLDPTSTYLLFNSTDKCSRLLIVRYDGSNPQVLCYRLQLPAGFVVTCGYCCMRRGFFMCGSRSGGLIVLRLADGKSLDLIVCCYKSRVHGSDAVTSILELPVPGKPDESPFFVTTGRDGTISCHKVTNTLDTTSLVTVHRTSPPFGPYIEGSYLSTTEDGRQALIVYGFKSKDFVVWNDTEQSLLMSVECGGAHRNWTFCPAETASNEIGTFIWTKAGTVNTFRNAIDMHRTILNGGHGREMKALALYRRPSQEVATEQFTNLIATGAEDTEIRIFGYASAAESLNEHTSLECLSTIPGHNTGLQHLLFSPCGRYLLSSGGAEEFCVWKLQKVPLLNIGVLRVAELAKTDEDSDARIMSFDIVPSQENSPQSDGFMAALAYSTGKIKILRFTSEDSRRTGGVHDIKDDDLHSDDHGYLEVVAEYSIGPTCLTQVQILVHGTELYNLTGATDGRLRLAKNDLETIPLAHQTHQSNISSLAVLDLGSNIKLAFTGGDDNALGITALYIGDKATSPRAQTILVPDAHAAAVTAVEAVQMYSSSTEHYLIISAGNDQKIQVWHLETTTPSQNPNLASESETSTESNSHQEVGYDENAVKFWKLEKLGEYWTDVADISGIKILNHVCVEGMPADMDAAATYPPLQVLIVGVGIQVLQIL